MMQQKNAMASQQSTTIAQKIQVVAALALFLAIPVIIFLRRRPGYRFIGPLPIMINFLLLSILASVSIVSGSTLQVAVITIFAWATLIIGLVKRRLRWNEIKKGMPWHSYSRGVSWFASVLPISDSMIKRWVDPIAVMLFGLVLSVVFRWLGLYLIVSGFFLYMFEAWDFEVRRFGVC